MILGAVEVILRFKLDKRRDSCVMKQEEEEEEEEGEEIA